MDFSQKRWTFVTFRLYYPLCVSRRVDTWHIVYLSYKDPCPNSFPLTLGVKAACFVLAIEVLLHARVLTLICACPISKANFSHYKFSNANLRHF